MAQLKLNTHDEVTFSEFYSVLQRATAESEDSTTGLWRMLKLSLLLACGWGEAPKGVRLFRSGFYLSDPGALMVYREQAASSNRHLKLVSFIRHGQSEANLACDVQGHAHGYWDPHLTEMGISQAKARAKELSLNSKQFDFDLIVVSPLTRTLETCYHGLAEYIERFITQNCTPLTKVEVYPL